MEKKMERQEILCKIVKNNTLNITYNKYHKKSRANEIHIKIKRIFAKSKLGAYYLGRFSLLRWQQMKKSLKTNILILKNIHLCQK